MENIKIILGSHFSEVYKHSDVDTIVHDMADMALKDEYPFDVYDSNSLIVHIKEDYVQWTNYSNSDHLMVKKLNLDKPRIIVAFCGERIVEQEYNPDVYLPTWNDVSKNRDLDEVETKFNLEFCNDCKDNYYNKMEVK